ncbi:MAG: hypothetical protein ACYCVD_08120 [Desulfitobacteriaceae bacterium]
MFIFIRKILTITLVGLTLMLSVPTVSMASTKQDNVTYGTWSRGKETVDPILPLKGFIVSPNGTKTPLTSPIHVIDKATLEKANNAKGSKSKVSPNDFWNGSYYYEYISGSYSQDSYNSDPYHYGVGQTQTYNSTIDNQTLTYLQNNGVTSYWSVSTNISTTAELKTEWLNKLAVTLGTIFTSASTTQASTSISTSITVRPGYSGLIQAFLPGGYSGGWAAYKEYYYDSYTGTFIATGNNLDEYESGWAPNAYGQQVDFLTSTWYGQ